MPGKCSFQQSGLKVEDLKYWIEQTKSAHEAFCKLYYKSTDISCMADLL